MTAEAPVPYWPQLYTPQVAIAHAVLPGNYTLTPAGEAVLDADLAADAELEAEAG